MSEKALKACADYARLSAEIKCLTRAIGDALSRCRGIKGERPESFDFSEERVIYYDAENGDHSHLKEAFSFDIDEDQYSPSRVYKTDAEIRDYLLESCPYCLTAYEHIVRRKQARKQFGIVKRSISAMGRAENRRNARHAK